MKKLKILILAWGFKSSSTKKLQEAAEKRGHTVIILSYMDMHLWFNNKGGHHMVYHKGKRIHRGDFDVIIPRIGRDLAKGVEILTILVYYLGMKTIILPEALSLVTNKWDTFSRLAQYGIVMPKTVKIYRFPYNLSEMVRYLGGYPLILKGETGSQGKGVVILETKTTAIMIIEAMVNEGSTFTLQQYVNTSHTKRKQDIRVWVIDGKVIGAYARFSGEDGDPRTNYSINKQGEPIQLTEQEKSIAVKTAQAVGLQVAAIDLARCVQTGKTYVYEVNGNGSLKGFTKVTQIPLADHIIDYAEIVAQSKAQTSKPTSIYIESTTPSFDDMDEGNTELISSRVTPSLKQYLQNYTDTYGYENLSATIKTLLYNASTYYVQNGNLQRELATSKDSVESLQNAHQQQKEKIGDLEDALQTLKTTTNKEKQQLESTIQKLQNDNQYQKEEIDVLKVRLQTLKSTIDKKNQRFQELSKRQSSSLYMGDHFNEFQDLTADLQGKYGEALPLLLFLYWQSVSEGYAFMPKLNKFVQNLKSAKI